MTATQKAKARAKRGIASSAEHAGKEWQDQAVAAARMFVRWNDRVYAGQPFIMEDVRHWCEARIDAPKEARAWGAATRRLKAEGIIEPTGFYALANSSNRSPKPLYRRAHG